MLILPAPAVGGWTCSAAGTLWNASWHTEKRRSHQSYPRKGTVCRFCFLTGGRGVKDYKSVFAIAPHPTRALVLTVIRDQQQLIHERKSDTEIHFLWKWPSCLEVQSCIPSPGKFRPKFSYKRKSWLQSKRWWWHSLCTQCNFSNTLGVQRWKKTVMGNIKAVLAQNMGKSCDEMNFYRSRVKWLRDTALDGPFPRVALVNEEKRCWLNCMLCPRWRVWGIISSCSFPVREE